jgi:hypothetical protein
MIDVPTDLGRIRSAPTADGVSGVEDFRSLRQRHDTSEASHIRRTCSDAHAARSLTHIDRQERSTGHGQAFGQILGQADDKTVRQQAAREMRKTQRAAKAS